MELLPLRRNNQDVFAEVAEFVMDRYLARSERAPLVNPFSFRHYFRFELSSSDTVVVALANWHLWLANCYFADFSSGSQLNVTMLRWLGASLIGINPRGRSTRKLRTSRM
jgi:hypothetical protein